MNGDEPLQRWVVNRDKFCGVGGDVDEFLFPRSFLEEKAVVCNLSYCAQNYTHA